MKLKDFLEKIEELSKTVTGELTVNLVCDCAVDKDIDLRSQSSKPKIEVNIKYPAKEKK